MHPPGWPQPPADWTPPPDWSPDPAWPPAPAGWQFWVDDESAASGGEPGAARRSRPRTSRELASSVAQRSGRAARASSTLWRRATASPTRHWSFGGAGLGVGLLAGALLVTATAAPPLPGTPTATGADLEAEASWAESGPTAIEAAVEDCDLIDSSGVSVGDEGGSVTIQTAGEDSSYGVTVFEMVCVLRNLDVSDRIVSRMNSTRALDGRQTGTWDGFDASWGYHPDDGMNLVVEEVE